MVVETILSTCAGFAVTQGASVIQSAGQDFLKATGKGVLTRAGAKFLPHKNGHLRRLIVASLAQAARGGAPGTPLGQAWRALERGAAVVVPNEELEDFAPIARAVVAGDASEMGAALAPLLSRAPDFPRLHADERAVLDREIGPLFRNAFADLMKSAQHDAGFKAFLRECLWALQSVPPPSLSPEGVGRLRGFADLPDLSRALDSLRATADRTLLIVEETESSVSRIEVKLDRLYDLTVLHIESEARMRRTVAEIDDQITILRLDLRRLEESGGTSRREEDEAYPVELSGALAMDRVNDRNRYIDDLKARNEVEQTLVQASREDLKSALTDLSRSEGDDLRRRALQAELQSGAQAAELVILESRSARPLQSDLDRIRVWLRAFELDRALEIWLTLVDERERPMSVLEAGDEIVSALEAADRFSESLSAARSHLEMAEASIGSEHPEALKSAHRLALLLYEAGLYGESEPLLISVLEARERVLSLNHPDTLDTRNALAILYIAVARYPEAEGLLTLMLEAARLFTLREVLTLGWKHNLAHLYLKTGRHEAAEALLLPTFEATRESLGDDDSETLKAASTLGRLYANTNRLEEARDLLARTLELGRRAHGAEHRLSLMLANNLAQVQEQLGELVEAEALLASTLETCRRKLGPDHPGSLACAHNLAWLFERTGRLAEAETLNTATLMAKRSTLGEKAPDTLITAHNLATLYSDRGRIPEAKALFARTLEAQVEVLGIGNESALGTAYKLIVLLIDNREGMAAMRHLIRFLPAARHLAARNEMRLRYEALARSYNMG